MAERAQAQAQQIQHAQEEYIRQVSGGAAAEIAAVSYTHLTLPTIYPV